MMRQYNSFKKQYPDKILLFRMGDFYETFGDDAVKASKILNITLTTRDKNSDPTPLAGFPHHAIDQYLPKIVQAGECAVVVEQLEDPKFAKGIVKRGVTRVVTPGTLDGDLATQERNPYLLCLRTNGNHLGIAYCDISTGELKVSRTNYDQRSVEHVISSLDPAEVILSEDENILKLNFENIQIFGSLPKNKKELKARIASFFGIRGIDGLGISDDIVLLEALYTILDYIEDTQKSRPEHISNPKLVSFDDKMILDVSTIRNLDLLRNSQTGSKTHSLMGILDETLTPMGKRRLHSWILNPLVDREGILERSERVDELFSSPTELSEVRAILAEINDIERIVGKIGLNRVNPRDLKALQLSLERTATLEDQLKNQRSTLKAFSRGVKRAQLDKVVEIIDQSIKDDPPANISEGGFIKAGTNKELDDIRELTTGSKDWLKELEKSEREKHQIPSLKVRFNKVFGYFIEVTKTHVDKVPQEYIRKQTLVNSERYITEELKIKEDLILNSQERINSIELAEFNKLRTELLQYIDDLKLCAVALSELDVIQSFAYVASSYDYVRPTLYEHGSNGSPINIVSGRHPVIERLVEDTFISNDTAMSVESERMIIITGPNMSGKSTYIRQVALIVLMSQIGSFVPAKQADISVTDRIFSRVGASDDLAQGRSTFMVEMEESANILNNATEKSLIILDEVGRGTSTYDGVSIAWALVEFLVSSIKARTLFATHYHELTVLEQEWPGIVANFNVEVQESGEEVIFMRKIVRGGTDKSYGIYVAQMAGLPKEVVNRANEILRGLDVQLGGDIDKKGSVERVIQKPEVQYKLFDEKTSHVEQLLEKADLDNLTPLQALELLAKLKGSLGSKQVKP